MELAAPVAIAEVRNFVQSHRMLREIIFCCLSSKVFSLYERLLREGHA
jgi:O-acetyl-ADP-ribose deacetylase (regulator of RNase III)